MSFRVGKLVRLKISPMKVLMLFGKKGKVSPHPFEVLDDVGLVAYKIALPPNLLEVHPVFHVFMLKNTMGMEIITLNRILILKKNLSSEEELVAILDLDI